ncbi:MAG: cytosine permease [Candidatus Methanomethyliaceae archaeon]|nr:cytosine permease [Candidatus Methanomethyliaceae archaeon]MDW7970712.1 cytosine permease [Nitrososphaerota archaeon]
MGCNDISSDLLPIIKKNVGVIEYSLMMISLTIATSIFFLGWIAQILGLSLIQAIVSSIIGSFVTAFLMYLNGHAGVKYGIPYPIQLRPSFGRIGALLPITMIIIVDIIWYGIDGFIAAWAFTEMCFLIWDGLNIENVFIYTPITLIIYLIILAIIGIGKIKTIKLIDVISGPLLFLFFLWFIIQMIGNTEFSNIPIWEYKAPWFGSNFFWSIAIQTAWWGMIVPNISDICRYNKHTKALIFGSVFGLAIPQIFGTIIGYIATCLVGGNMSPIEVIARFSPTPLAGALGLFFAFLATTTTNLTGYLLGLMNAFCKIFKLSWNRTIVIITISAFLIAPWYIRNSMEVAYQLLDITWYYSMFLGPLVGVMITDYWIIRKRKLNVKELYREESKKYNNGINWNGIGALIMGILLEYIIAAIQEKLFYVYFIPLPGFELVWYYGLIFSSISYLLLNKIRR